MGRAVLVVVALVVACRFDLDKYQAPRVIDSNIDGANNVRMQCEINTVSSLCTNADALTDCGPGSGSGSGSGSGAPCFTYIKTKIFNANCSSTSCHSASGTGKLDLSTGKDDTTPVTQDQAWANLLGSDGMGADSMVDKTRKLVVPGHPEQSYLELMMQKVAPADMVPPAADPPSDVGYMPQANGVLCCQKLDLIDRWIRGGALNN
jgi:hypothetical protein